MDHSRSQNRKLVTYSSSKNRSSPKARTKPGGAESSTSQDPLVSQSGIQHTGESGFKHWDNNTSDSTSNIYDLPSSDEDEHRLLRRKRRRYGTKYEGINTQPATTEHAQPAAHSSEVFSERCSPAKSRLVNIPQPSKTERLQPKQLPETKRISSRSKASQAQTSRPASGRARHERVDNKRHTKSVDTGRPPSQNQRPTTPENRSPKDAVLINSTPGRRRLIDSLGTQSLPSDRSPTTSHTPAENPLSSPELPHTPPRPLQSVQAEDQREETGLGVNITVSPHLQGSKVTYAQQRSFLDDMPLETSLSLSNIELGIEQPTQKTEGLRSPREPPHARLIAVEDLGHDDGTVRSIHELRQAGGNARFRATIESIFEDIEDTKTSISGRCSSFVQLCSKLMEPKLARQFVECNFDRRLLDCLSRDFDMTSAALALCVFSVSSAVRPMPYIVAKSALPKLLEISGPMLDTCETVDSVAQDPGNRVSKAVQVSVKDMLSQISPVLFLDTPITDVSPRLVALKCLKMTLSKIQESGEPHETIPTFILRKVVDLLLAETSPPASRNLHFSPSSAQTLTLGLSILELHTTSRALQKEDPDFLGSLSGLQRLLQVQDSKLDSIIEDIQTLYIRVVLNVTNSNPLLCDVFATRVMITELTKVAITNFKDLTKESPPEETSALDRVILSLGALINLTEQSETSRVVFLKHTHASQTLLGQLLRLFLAHVYSTSEAHSVPELNHNVAVGYLAVLLLSLCLNAEARAEIKKQLQSRGLETVMSTVEEFQQYYRKIEQESRPSSAQEETSAFHIRLQDLMSQIQQIEA